MVHLSLPLLLTLAAAAMAVVVPNNAGARNVGSGSGSQFITGPRVCSAEAAQFQNDKQGCGFVDPNAAATIAAAQEQVRKQGF
ncbi:hypothetical protein OQA88_8018 [Cercophora sp. LCS_1]